MTGGCSDDRDSPYPSSPPPPPSLDGTLEYSWTINGRQVAGDCAEAGAVSFESVIVDHGFVIDGERVPCEDFELSVPIYAGDFLSRSALTDVNRVPALRRIVEDTFDIQDGKVTTLVIDFPSPPLPMDPEPDAGAPALADAGEPPSDGVDAGVDGGPP
jgi:hypothetical protein